MPATAGGRIVQGESMLKKSIVILIALFLVAGAAFGVSAVLAQEAEEAPVPAPSFPGGYGPGHMWQWQQDGEQPTVPYGPMHGRGGMMGGWMMKGNTILDVVADTLGLTIDELLAELNQGLSIAGLAEERGIDVETLISSVSEAHAQALQEAVDEGWMTQEQADWMQEIMAAMIATYVNQAWTGGFGPGAGRRYGPGGCHGDTGDPDGTGATYAPRGCGGMRGGTGQQAPVVPQGPGA